MTLREAIDLTGHGRPHNKEAISTLCGAFYKVQKTRNKFGRQPIPVIRVWVANNLLKR